MNKLPFFAIAFCTLLLVMGLSPATALNPSFPADGDVLDYELRGQINQTNNTGPPHANYPLEMDYHHEIINHTGNTYYANITILMIEPADYLHLAPGGNETYFAIMHNYTSSLHTLQSVNPDDWSEKAPYYYLDYFYIPKQTEVGDTVFMGFYDYYGSYGVPPGTLIEFGTPVGPGPDLTVGGNTLNTVGGKFEYQLHYDGPVTHSISTIDMELSAEFYWEWSLGFLAYFRFDLYENLNPNYEYNYNITTVNAWGTFNLTSYTLTDTPTPMTTTTTPITSSGIPGFPVAAIGAGILIALVPTIILRKRRQ